MSLPAPLNWARARSNEKGTVSTVPFYLCSSLTTFSYPARLAARQCVGAESFIRCGESNGQRQGLAVTNSGVGCGLARRIFILAQRTGMLLDVKTLDYKLAIPIGNDSFGDAAMSTVVVDTGAAVGNLQGDVLPAPNSGCQPFCFRAALRRLVCGVV